MALKDWGYLNFEEPFPNFFAHGLVIKEGAKMSKSKGNVVNPDEYIKLYGSDALRMYLMFMGPFSEGGDFRDAGMEGMARWVGRIWRIAMASLEPGADAHASDTLIKLFHKTIKKVGEDTDKRHYNTAIAAMMELTNLIADEGGTLPSSMLKTFLLILAPYAPHITEELWYRSVTAVAGSPASEDRWSVHQQLWPSYEPNMLVEETISIIVQVNGKLRDTVAVDIESASNQKKIEAIVQSSEKVKKFLGEQNPRKIIFVPGKLINFVI